MYRAISRSEKHGAGCRLRARKRLAERARDYCYGLSRGETKTKCHREEASRIDGGDEFPTNARARVAFRPNTDSSLESSRRRPRYVADLSKFVAVFLSHFLRSKQKKQLEYFHVR